MRLRPKVRIDVLSGFLGSGKTTLLRRHLASIDSSGIALVINEFGATSIDHRLVRASDDATSVIADGCACCAVATRLRETLLDLLRDDARTGQDHVKRIVLETSGLAAPSAILNTLRTDEVLDEYLEIGSCIVAFDAIDGDELALRYGEVMDQIAAADTVVITKADIAGMAAVESAQRFVLDANPLARVIVAGTPGFSDEKLFAAAAGRPTPISSTGHTRHATGVASFCLSVNRPLDWASFSVWLTCLLNRHGSRILRFKAVIDPGPHELPLIVQGVRHIVHPPQHVADAARDRGRSDLVFIVDGMDPVAIEKSLWDFLDFARSHLKPVAVAAA
jgi:G3E family GTPase